MVRHRDGAGTAPVRAQRAHWFGSKPPRMESSPPSRRARPRRFDDSIACPRRPESLRSGLIPCRSRRPVRQIEPLAILDAIELNGIGSVRATTVFRQCRFCLCERQRQVVYGFSPFSGPPILKKRRRSRVLKIRALPWRGRTQPFAQSAFARLSERAFTAAKAKTYPPARAKCRLSRAPCDFCEIREPRGARSTAARADSSHSLQQVLSHSQRVRDDR